MNSSIEIIETETHRVERYADDYVLKVGRLYFDYYDFDLGRHIGQSDPYAVRGFDTLEEARAEAKAMVFDNIEAKVVRRTWRPKVTLTEAGRNRIAERRAQRKYNG